MFYTYEDHQQQEDNERLLGEEFDKLKDEIERKEYKIIEKDKEIHELQRRYAELDEQLKVAQHDSSQNKTLINCLTESMAGLKQQVKRGNDELQTMKEDKKTYKNTLDFIVKKDMCVKKFFIKKTITLQKRVNLEQKKIAAVQLAKELDSSEYENRIEHLIQEKQDLEERNSQLRESALQDQNKIHSLEEENRAKVTEMTEEINSLHNQLRLQTQETQQLLEKRAAEMTEEMDNVIQQLNQERVAREQLRKQYEEEQAKQDKHTEKIAEFTKDNEHLKERILQLERIEETVSCSSVIFLYTCILYIIKITYLFNALVIMNNSVIVKHRSITCCSVVSFSSSK